MWGTRRVLQELAEQRREFRVLLDEVKRDGADDRQLTREVLRRHEVVTQELIKEIADLRADFKQESRRNQESLRRLNETSEAHTKAIFALIDRLQNGPSPAGGAA